VPAGIGQHIIGNRDEFDVGDGDARFLECLTRRANIGRFAKVEVSARRGPKSALILNKQKLTIANDDAANANVRNLVWNIVDRHSAASGCSELLLLRTSHWRPLP
jgi:hypothetical protein